jgi:hypothetical protein
MNKYDSRPETYEHIAVLRYYLLDLAMDLIARAHIHDQSKLESPEVQVFDKFTPLLADTTYGSPEYQEHLAAMGVALRHHYAVNPHHPEHWDRGIHGMNLLDLIEMLCDWKAATERHADGDLDKSITINRQRFGYGDEIEGLLRNTAARLRSSVTNDKL